MIEHQPALKRKGSRVLAIATLVSVATIGFAPGARAEDRVVTITEVTIVGRVQKPIATVDVSRIRPKLSLGELKEPFLYRIEKALVDSPF